MSPDDKKKLDTILSLVYPVGSVYISSKDTDPATLFGGKWKRIKDKFIMAAGDTYKAGTTGGVASVTLTNDNLPTHSHSFTPSGTVTVAAHSHSFTPAGSVSVGAHSHSFSWSGSHSHNFVYLRKQQGQAVVGQTVGAEILCNGKLAEDHINSTVVNVGGLNQGTGNLGHYLHIGDSTINVSGTTGSATPTASFTGSAGTTGGATPTASFAGTAGTTGSAGDGKAFTILPPYETKYMWERTE